MKHSTFIAAVVQHPPVYLDLSKSIQKACQLITEAAHEEAQLFVFSET